MGEVELLSQPDGRQPGRERAVLLRREHGFHPWGDWTCLLQSRNIAISCGGAIWTLKSLKFNLQKSGPNPVDLRVTSDPPGVRLVSASLADGAAAAEAVQAASFLGHADPGAPAGGGDDVDSWNVQGSTGKPAVVRLEGDDTAGYTGGAATLRLESGGAVLAQASGALPLELSGQLGAGTHQIVVVEPAAGGGGPQEAGFRGHYLLTMTPQGGAEGVLLEPQPDVEPHE